MRCMRWAALVVLVAVGTAALAQQGDTAKSGKGVNKTKFTFFNAVKKPVEVFQLDEMGKEVAKGKVEAGKSMTYDTYAEYLWRFKVDGKTMHTVPAGRGPASAFSFIMPNEMKAAAGPAEGDGKERSWDRGTDEVEITFKNGTSKTLDLFWVDREGKEQSYGKIEAGKEYVQKTFNLHLWRLKADGKTYSKYRADTKAKQTHTINPPETKVGTGKSTDVVTGSDMTAKEAEEILAYHNKVRKDVGVGALTWSASISKFAQEWANYLGENGLMVHRPRQGDKAQKYGENIAINVSALRGAEAWHSEKADYTAGTAIPRDFASFKAGHYTQMVWKNSKQIGVGKALIKQGRYKGMFVIVANYDPPGNYTGQTPY